MVLCPEVQRGAGKHSRTYALVTVDKLYLYRESTGSRVDGRINKADFAFELLVTIDIYFHGYGSALLHFGKVAFGYVDV